MTFGLLGENLVQNAKSIKDDQSKVISTMYPPALNSFNTYIIFSKKIGSM